MSSLGMRLGDVSAAGTARAPPARAMVKVVSAEIFIVTRDARFALRIGRVKELSTLCEIADREYKVYLRETHAWGIWRYASLETLQ